MFGYGERKHIEELEGHLVLLKRIGELETSLVNTLSSLDATNTWCRNQAKEVECLKGQLEHVEKERDRLIEHSFARKESCVRESETLQAARNQHMAISLAFHKEKKELREEIKDLELENLRLLWQKARASERVDD